MGPRRNHTQAKQPPRWLAICAAALVLTACEPQHPQAGSVSHLSSLRLALGIDRAPSSSAIAPTPPPIDTVQLPLPPDSLATLDVLSLSGCAVQANIRRRATALGRWAKPSQRLLLTLEYLRQAPACIRRLRADENHTLAGFLQVALDEQQAQLPALIFNATLGSEEYRALWLVDRHPGGFARVRHRNTVTALLAINTVTHNWLSGDYSAWDREFELWLGEVAGGDGGALLNPISLDGDTLNTANLEDLLSPTHALEAMLAETLPEGYRGWALRRNAGLELTENASCAYQGDRLATGRRQPSLHTDVRFLARPLDKRSSHFPSHAQTSGANTSDSPPCP